MLRRLSCPTASTASHLAGDRRFVRVLQLLGEHPLDRVRQAVEACRIEQLISAEAAIQRTHTLAAIEARLRGSSPSDLEQSAALKSTCRFPT